MFSEVPFSFEGKVAVLANVWTDVGVCSDVLFQHAGLLTADTALSTDVLSPAATSHVNILFIGLVPAFKDANTRRLALFGRGGFFLFSFCFLLLLFMMWLILHFSEAAGWGGMYLHSRNREIQNKFK